MRNCRSKVLRILNAKTSGWENRKSLRKTKFLIVAPLVLASGLLCPSGLPQEPPSAPVPKVPQDAPPASQTKPQDAQTPASQQNPSDSQTTLKFSVNYVFLPVTVK